MELEVTLLTRRGAAVMHRAHWVNADRVRFGRGTNNEVPLPDIRVELVAAMLTQHDGGLAIEARGDAPIRVNGTTVTSAPVGPGDEVLIGPYRILFGEPPENSDGALSVELVQPLGDALNALVSGSRIGLGASAFSKRTMSWIGFAVIALLCLAAPIVVYSGGFVPSWREVQPGVTPAGVFTLSWNPGDLSNTHRQFAADCAACHQAAFTAVKDGACLSCHAGIGAHAEKAARLGPLRARLDATRCTACHEEHRGIGGLIIQEAALCVNCHRNLAETAPDAGIRDIASFPAGHPQFRATLAADPASGRRERADLATTPPPRDNPGLNFSHAAHLVKGGFPPLGYKEMVCADCHVAEPGGLGFLPITYERQCKSCHALKFDSSDLPWPGAVVPHGDDSGIVAAVWNYYAGKALQGAMPAPATPAVTRRTPGTPPTPADLPKDALAWVAQRADAALRGVILDDKRGCAYCHIGTGPQGRFETATFLPAPMASKPAAQMRIVAPVMMQARFLPKARFRHASHAASACEDCHDARHSASSHDVLIPDKTNCLRCHGPERAGLKVQSTCTTCHVFHHGEFGLMRETASAR
jgi:predicted CXXCH cytochrome family protein